MYIIMYTSDGNCPIFARFMRAPTIGIISPVILIKYYNIFRLYVWIVCCAVDTLQPFFLSTHRVDSSHAFSRTPPRITYACPRSRIAFDTKLFVIMMIIVQPVLRGIYNFVYSIVFSFEKKMVGSKTYS